MTRLRILYLGKKGSDALLALRRYGRHPVDEFDPKGRALPVWLSPASFDVVIREAEVDLGEFAGLEITEPPRDEAAVRALEAEIDRVFPDEPRAEGVRRWYPAVRLGAKSARWTLRQALTPVRLANRSFLKAGGLSKSDLVWLRDSLVLRAKTLGRKGRTAPRQKAIDSANARFWDEPCGTVNAQQMGIAGQDAQSIRAQDRWYLDYYPYLEKYLDLPSMKGKRVLEVGLGYGTVAQKIMEAGADYTGVDIAAGPVEMVRRRQELFGLQGKLVVGSFLKNKLKAKSFDVVVSIGCFHHTGDVQRCVDEVHRLLKPGGRAVIMLYNGLSYWQWFRFTEDALVAWLDDTFVDGPTRAADDDEERNRNYDRNSKGVAAPSTVFLTPKQMRNTFARFSDTRLHKENVTELFSRRVRLSLLPTVGRAAGLDVYITATK